MRIVKIIFIVLLIIAALLSLNEVIKDGPCSLIKNLKNKNLDSKALVLKIKFFGIIPGAVARIEDLGIEKFDRKNVFHLRATAQTMSYFSKMFNAQMQADSYVDVGKLCPLKFVQRVKTPGKYDYNREIIYDQELKVMKIGDVQREIFQDTRDPISAVFYIRNQEFKIGKEMTTYINTNQKNYIMTAKVLDYKELTINGEKTNYWLMTAEVKRADKNPRHKTHLTIWFFDNKTKTPFLIKIMSAGGLVTASLIGLN